MRPDDYDKVMQQGEDYFGDSLETVLAGGLFPEEFVNRFVKKYFLDDPKKRVIDPVDDLARFCEIASQLHFEQHGVKSTYPDPSPLARLPKPFNHVMWHEAAAKLLHTMGPVFSELQWKQLLYEVGCRRHGGTYVRIRKRPALAKARDAANLTPKELMEKYGISRSRAYQLRKVAVKARPKKPKNEK